MNPMTSADPRANSVFAVPVIPGGMSQVSQYPHNQPQVHLIPGNQPGLEPSVYGQPAQRGLTEGKALGAIQILIGLIHIGLGSIMGAIFSRPYTAVSFYGGFPFWGGIWFIISGALSVSAENQPKSTCLLNGSLGLNIVSAVCSVVGIILFIMDMSINSLNTDPVYPVYPNYPNYTDYYLQWGMAPGMAISGVLLIFCLLEFCIACTSAHFGCQLACCSHNNVNMAFPNIYMANRMVVPEPANSPLPSMYPKVVQGSK